MAWHAGAGMGWWMLFGGLLWLVFWGTVIYLIVSVIRGDQRPVRDDRPIEIAKRRYASGEIDKTEFDRIRHDLAALKPGMV
jgi:putative membrane protein